MPSADELPPPHAYLPVLRDEVIEPRFSAEEAQRIGLMDEASVDWNGQVDIDLSAEAAPAEGELDIAGLPKSDAAEPSSGKSLADHVQIGFAYQMHLDERVAEGAAEPCQPGAHLLRLHARRPPQADHLDDAPHAGAAVRHRPAARLRERLPDRTRHRACAPSAGGPGRRRRRPERAAARRRAMRSAAFRLDASARPLPAMSKAVPWSGLVRTKGRPSVTLTPCSTPRYFTGISPWSCVIATTRSNSPVCPGAWRARMNTVSGAKGPLGVDAEARAPPRWPGR